MVEVTNYFAVPHTELRQINLAYLVTNAHVKFFCFSLETINKVMAVTAECKKSVLLSNLFAGLIHYLSINSTLHLPEFPCTNGPHLRLS